MAAEQHRDADRARLYSLVTGVVERCASEPGLNDFLLWWGGTLEYWIHIVASSVGNHLVGQGGWAARSEVPYITAAPALSAKTPVKWADGAVLWDDGLLCLLEVKSIPMRKVLGSSAHHIPTDIAALLSADWPGTVAHERGTDTYTDERWWTRRHDVKRVWGLAIGLVHGLAPLEGAADAFSAALNRGRTTLQNRHRADLPGWLANLEAACDAPLISHEPVGTTGGEAAGAFYAWAAPVLTPGPSICQRRGDSAGGQETL